MRDPAEETEAGAPGVSTARESASTIRALLSLAWPAVLSYSLNNAYRINDQFWIQGLGGAAQSAVGATFFVHVMLFAVTFLAVGGTLALVSRAVGAREPGRRDSVVRHALLFGLLLGLSLTLLVLPWIPEIVGLLGLGSDPQPLAESYLGTLYLFLVPLVLFPVVDSIFIGRGNTRVPMALQLVAVSTNWFLNPILIYGEGAAEHVAAPGVGIVAAVAGALGVEPRGIAGAALATGISRTVSVVLGLLILRYGAGTRLLGRPPLRWSILGEIARISYPVCVSIAIYSGAYWILLGGVLGPLGDDVVGGLGLGFQVFEGLAFPCYLGVSIAASSLVGRALGARDPAAAWRVVRDGRRVGRVLGLAFAALFLLGRTTLVPFFTQDPGVASETELYVLVLAFSQYHVAVETMNEKVLLGSGYTRPIIWISPLGNLLRVPLGWLLATRLGYGAAGVWWAINLTTYLKAFLFWTHVQRGRWVRLDDEAPAAR